MDEGTVLVKTNRNSLGFIESQEYTFPNTRMILLDQFQFNSAKEISLGGLQLVLVEEGIYFNSKYVRKDDWIARLYFLFYRNTEILRLAYRRFILTLVIWNLASCSQGEIPGWHCVVRRWTKVNHAND